LSQTGKRVVFVLDGPNFNHHIPDYLFKSYIRGTTPDLEILTVGVADQRSATAFTPSFLDSFKSIAYVDSLELFCDREKCSALLASGRPLVVDSGHISHEASNILANEVFKALERLSPKQSQ
jgi:SGNH domain (fused to AT3 domains)